MGNPSLSGKNLRIHYTIKSLIVERYPHIQVQLYVRCDEGLETYQHAFVYESVHTHILHFLRDVQNQVHVRHRGDPRSLIIIRMCTHN